MARSGESALVVAVGEKHNDPVGGIFYSNDLGYSWSPVIPVNAPLHDILWDGQKFVACGDDGLILSSLDGAKWQSPARVSARTSLVALCRGNGQYVVLGSEGNAFKSTDLKTWSRQGVIPGNPTSLLFNGHSYVAVGKRGGIWTSSDARLWQTISTGFSNDLYGIAESHGILIAAGEAGLVLRSTDNTHWQQEFEGLPAFFDTPYWTGSRFIMVDWWTRAFLNSEDGRSWNSQPIDGPSLLVGGITPFPGGYLCVDMLGGTAWTSPDGVTWEAHASNHGQNSIFGKVWFKDHFIGVGENGAVHTSIDGYSWTEAPSFSQNTLSSIAFGAGRLVAVGYNGIVYVSEDGESWRTTPGSELGWMYDLQWTEERGFLALSGESLMQSADGLTWTTHILPNVYITGYAVGGDRLYVLGAAGNIVSTADMTSWTTEDSGTTNSLRSGAASPSCLLVVGDYGTLLRRR